MDAFSASILSSSCRWDNACCDEAVLWIANVIEHPLIWFRTPRSSSCTASHRPKTCYIILDGSYLLLKPCSHSILSKQLISFAGQLIQEEAWMLLAALQLSVKLVEPGCQLIKNVFIKVKLLKTLLDFRQPMPRGPKQLFQFSLLSNESLLMFRQ